MARLKVMGIYCIHNRVRNLMYVGSSCDLRSRLLTHKRELRKGCHHSRYLQRAWDKYGEASFDFGIVEFVDKKDDLLQIEQSWIDSIGHYNVSREAKRPSVVITEETRRKISNSLKGRPSPTKGTMHTEESKRKMREARRGQDRSATGPAISKAKKGVPMKESTKSLLRKPKAPEAKHQFKIAAAAKFIAKGFIGRTVTETIINHFDEVVKKLRENYPDRPELIDVTASVRTS